MNKTVWLALICVISLAVIASVKLISTHTGKSASKIVDPFDEMDVTPLAVKTDKLSASDIADNTLPNKVLVRTLKIAPQLSKQAVEEKAAPAAQKHSGSAFAELRGRVHRHKRSRRHR